MNFFKKTISNIPVITKTKADYGADFQSKERQYFEIEKVIKRLIEDMRRYINLWSELNAMKTKIYASLLFFYDKNTSKRKVADELLSTCQLHIERGVETLSSYYESILFQELNQILAIFPSTRNEIADLEKKQKEFDIKKQLLDQLKKNKKPNYLQLAELDEQVRDLEYGYNKQVRKLSREFDAKLNHKISMLDRFVIKMLNSDWYLFNELFIMREKLLEQSKIMQYFREYPQGLPSQYRSPSPSTSRNSLSADESFLSEIVDDSVTITDTNNSTTTTTIITTTATTIATTTTNDNNNNNNINNILHNFDNLIIDEKEKHNQATDLLTGSIMNNNDIFDPFKIDEKKEIKKIEQKEQEINNEKQQEENFFSDLFDTNASNTNINDNKNIDIFNSNKEENEIEQEIVDEETQQEYEEEKENSQQQNEVNKNVKTPFLSDSITTPAIEPFVNLEQSPQPSVNSAQSSIQQNVQQPPKSPKSGAEKPRTVPPPPQKGTNSTSSQTTNNQKSKVPPPKRSDQPSENTKNLKTNSSANTAKVERNNSSSSVASNSSTKGQPSQKKIEQLPNPNVNVYYYCRSHHPLNISSVHLKNFQWLHALFDPNCTRHLGDPNSTMVPNAIATHTLFAKVVDMKTLKWD